MKKGMRSFVVIGLGRFGSAVALELYKLGYEVLGVDASEEQVNRVSEHLTHAVVADAREEHALKTLGVRNFDCAVVAAADDLQSSVMITLLLKELNVPYIVAKAQNLLHQRLLYKIGADRVIFPEMDMGLRLAESLVSRSFTELAELSDDYKIIEIACPRQWVGRTLQDIDVRSIYNVNIIAIKGPRQAINSMPGAADILSADDTLLALGAKKDLQKLNESL